MRHRRHRSTRRHHRRHSVARSHLSKRRSRLPLYPWQNNDN
jgi:hypothetical protein